MARRRFQAPRPVKRGAWWVLRYWQDEFVGDKRIRIRKRDRIAPASTPVQEVKKIAAEKLRPLNQGLETIGSATNFEYYVDHTYIPLALPTKAKGTRDCYRTVIEHYLKPAFGGMCLRDLTPTALDRYFVDLTAEGKLAQESVTKVRTVLASVIKRAIRDGLLLKNPLDGHELPRPHTGRRRPKPYVTPEQFALLLARIPEPYASMVFVAIYTGLRFSELAGLRWNDIHQDSITIDERYYRGEWGAPKSEASNTTIAVNPCVIERIQRLKQLTVSVRAGLATRRYRVVKSDGPEDLVFQSVMTGSPIRDGLILSRYLKPAGRAVGIPWLNWRCLRTSHAVWLKLAGADVKDAQGQMRHSRASTTLDIYQQFVPESQRRVVAKLSQLVQ
jgi:integrase